MPEEIDHTVYASNSNYEKAVAGHIANFLNLQDVVSKCNEEKILKFWEYFDRKYVKKLGVHLFAVGNVVLMNIKKQIKDIKNVGVRWIGPCTVVYERLGKLFDIEYKCKGQVLKYLRVHPKFLKCMWGKLCKQFIL